MLCISVSLAILCILKSYMLSIDMRERGLNYERRKKTYFLSRKAPEVPYKSKHLTLNLAMRRSDSQPSLILHIWQVYTEWLIGI